VLGESTVALIADFCGDSSVFASAHQLRKRIVRWGTDPPQAVFHAALSMGGTTLQRELFDTVAALPSATNSGFHSWHVFSSPEDLPGESTRLKIGERVTLACEVALAAGADSGTCLIESTQDGWAFLAPLSDRCALLQATVPVRPQSAPEALAALVSKTRYISRGVNSVETEVKLYTTAPSLNLPCGGRDWLSVGAAAFQVDPLCGDGTGHSFRSGLLAAGVIRAIADGQPYDMVLTHFNERIRATFAAHLMACKTYYAPTNFGKAWAKEIKAIQTGANYISSLPKASLRFQFQNLHLIPVTDAHDSGRGASARAAEFREFWRHQSRGHDT
jgi:hypothetical protein